MLSQNLKHLRESRLGISQSNFAEIFNISRGMVASYEAGSEPPIQVLIAIAKHFDISIDDLISGSVQIESSFNKTKKMGQSDIDQPKLKLLPYYDIDVSAGSTMLLNDLGKEIAESYFSIPAFDDCDFAINVWGDSMYPRYKNGDIIICKELHDWKTYIQYGEVHLVVTKQDHHRFVKYIRKSENKHFFKMVSENPKHDPFEVPHTDIQKIFIVKGKVERNQI